MSSHGLLTLLDSEHMCLTEKFKFLTTKWAAASAANGSWSGRFHWRLGERAQPSLDADNQLSWAVLAQEVRVSPPAIVSELGTLSAQAGLTTFLQREG